MTSILNVPLFYFFVFISDFSLFTIAVCAFPSVKFLAACPAFRLYLVVAHQLAGGLPSVTQGGLFGLVAAASRNTTWIYICRSLLHHHHLVIQPAPKTPAAAAAAFTVMSGFLKPQPRGEKLENCYQKHSDKQTDPACTDHRPQSQRTS